jgi:hypothetical protein
MPSPTVFATWVPRMKVAAKLKNAAQTRAVNHGRSLREG